MSSLRYVFTCTLFALGGRYKNIARATEAAKMPNKKISSCAVDTVVVVLVISVVQQSAGLAKIAGYRWCEIKLSCFSIYSQGAIKHFSFVVENGG